MVDVLWYVDASFTVDLTYLGSVMVGYKLKESEEVTYSGYEVLWESVDLYQKNEDYVYIGLSITRQLPGANPYRCQRKKSQGSSTLFPLHFFGRSYDICNYLTSEFSQNNNLKCIIERN
jgi:hypothetical protein